MRAGASAEDVFTVLDDLHFHLLVVGQDAPDAAALGLGDRVRIHRIPDDPDNARELAAVGIPAVCYYLVREDGHVSLCGRRLDTAAVRRYAAETLALTSIQGFPIKTPRAA